MSEKFPRRLNRTVREHPMDLYCKKRENQYALFFFSNGKKMVIALLEADDCPLGANTDENNQLANHMR